MFCAALPHPRYELDSDKQIGWAPELYSNKNQIKLTSKRSSHFNFNSMVFQGVKITYSNLFCDRIRLRSVAHNCVVDEIAQLFSVEFGLELIGATCQRSQRANELHDILFAFCLTPNFVSELSEHQLVRCNYGWATT